ncbi:hypothetical protein GLE_5113 [Lysobacter enzymogenes]|uniref:Uncharacterized protein n=1 Tax=Lysobacter enzymogenes TaxID=69 RepID=A0A0S2DP94_LYSEN|nr:hypothetical protein GLE_5113 [Lysobacter enzymogenes]
MRAGGGGHPGSQQSTHSFAPKTLRKSRSPRVRARPGPARRRPPRVAQAIRAQRPCDRLSSMKRRRPSLLCHVSLSTYAWRCPRHDAGPDGRY